MNKKEVRNLVVTDNAQLNATNFLIKLSSSEPLPKLLPGQFVNIEIKDSSEIFLRRPFSVFDVDYSQNSFSIIVKILGRGSKKLTEIIAGKSLSVILPLGKSFTFPEMDDRILLVGGGSGVAPMLFLAKLSGLKKENVNLLLGAKTIEDHVNVDRYAQYGNLFFTTEDGSFGEKGFVTQHSVFQNNLSRYNKIYACGPGAMMKAIAKEASKADVFCEVSLENLMACGFGVCLCCIEPTIKGNLCVCTEGPVFNINDLKW
jgi:dihydroorotate dehydrogenase electron transfer subunit